MVLPVLPVALAESEPSSEHYIDPTTSTAFPTFVSSPSGSKLRLVGTGVRTVSFLAIRVYAAGFYVGERMYQQLGQVEGFQVSSACSSTAPSILTDRSRGHSSSSFTGLQVREAIAPVPQAYRGRLVWRSTHGEAA